MNRFAFLLCLSIAWGNVSQANKITDFYEIESVSPPELLLRRYGNSKGGQGTQADGLDFMPDGRLVACFVGGEVFTLHPKTGKWKLFADGLHTPLGVVALNDREVMVSQRPELTRLKDSNGDGVADEYSVFSDDFGVSGNYHEFHFGPVRDKDGNFYVALGTASSGTRRRRDASPSVHHQSSSPLAPPHSATYGLVVVSPSPHPLVDLVNKAGLPVRCVVHGHLAVRGGAHEACRLKVARADARCQGKGTQAEAPKGTHAPGTFNQL